MADLIEETCGCVTRIDTSEPETDYWRTVKACAKHERYVSCPYRAKARNKR